MVSHLHGRNRSKDKSELEVEQEEKAKGRGHKEETEDQEQDLKSDAESPREQHGKKHQRGFGKNQDKEAVDRAPNYPIRTPGAHQI